MSVKYHLSVNGPNRELFGVQTENEAYGTFVAAAQEAGLDEVLEQLSSGSSSLAKAVGVAQTITAPPPAPWGAPPVPPFQPAAAQPYQPQQQAAPPQRTGQTKVDNGHCIHGPATYRESKPGAPKQWRGYFCPAPKGAPDQCDPEFQR
jgi:hypothetical protein